MIGLGIPVESRKGAGPGPTGSRLFPFPAHQTGRARFEHPAFRQTSPSAHGSFRHEKTQDTKFPEHHAVRVPGRAQRRHVVAAPQEHSDALIDVVIDGPIGRVAISLAEVTGPASQRCIEAIPHLRPRHHVPRLHQASHFLPESGHALLGWTLSEKHRAILAKAMRSERIPQKGIPLFVYSNIKNITWLTVASSV